MTNKKESSEPLKENSNETLLCEVSWEVCQQLGGIYTVIRSKVPAMVKKWDKSYCLIGPYNPATSPAEFEPATPTGPFGKVVKTLQANGIDAHYGYWLITGRPRVVLLNPRSVMNRIHDIKKALWDDHKISTITYDGLVDECIAFGHIVTEFFTLLSKQESPNRKIIGHFHEWMAGSAIPDLRMRKLPVATVFTTHATQLGRFLAMEDPNYYEHIRNVNWHDKSKHFNIESKAMIERAAAHGANVMTTVSDLTAEECEHLLGRKADVLLPNGLNIERFAALHEFQNLHRLYKEKIHQLVIGHFFPSYSFDLDKTLYMFVSGRYEYQNKGFDLSIESMARLNRRLKQEKSPLTVVFFIITKGGTRSINANVLNNRAVMEEIRRNCEAIQKQIGERLFVSASMGSWPRLDELVDDYWRLRLRRTIYTWKTKKLPPVVTHDMLSENDAILNQLRAVNLLNHPDDPVKVVYHPDFVTSSNPLFGLDYDQFVRGCHLGIFPSTYEPWGYAPLECIALGIPAVTTDLSGFGSYVSRNMPEYKNKGILVLKRRHHSYDASANELTNWIADFVNVDRRGRIAMRNEIESMSGHFDWQNLGKFYNTAHEMAVKASK